VIRKVLIAPDSFKGTLSARQVTDTIAAEVAAMYPDCEIEKLPIADGGEGSVETIIAAVGGRLEHAQVLSPDGRQIDAHFGVTADSGQAPNHGSKAVLEVAQSSGITRQLGLHPMTSSTYGFGQLIMAALDLGLRDFFLCIGGSASTDGGCGMAAALGVRFFGDNGESFVPNGATLQKIACIDMNDIDKRVHESNFTVMCDVTNPLFGINGAAHVYAPQKGATAEEVHQLDAGLLHLSEICLQTFGSNYADVPGAGAAGGLGFGCMTMLQAQLESGIDAILDLCDFEKRLVGTDLIITGEGKLDSQSFSGKVLSGILQNRADVPVISLCGVCDLGDMSDTPEDLLRKHNLTIFEISEGISVEESLANPEQYLRQAARKALTAL